MDRRRKKHNNNNNNHPDWVNSVGLRHYVRVSHSFRQWNSNEFYSFHLKVWRFSKWWTEILRIHIENCTCGELCAQNVFDICVRRQSLLSSYWYCFCYFWFTLLPLLLLLLLISQQLQQQLQTTKNDNTTLWLCIIRLNIFRIIFIFVVLVIAGERLGRFSVFLYDLFSALFDMHTTHIHTRITLFDICQWMGKGRVHNNVWWFFVVVLALAHSSARLFIYCCRVGFNRRNPSCVWESIIFFNYPIFIRVYSN